MPEGGAAMALRNVTGDRYGRVKLEGNRVLSFHAAQENVKGPINGGIYALSRAVVETIPDGKVSLEGDIFPSLAARGGIRGREFNGYFIDIAQSGQDAVDKIKQDPYEYALIILDYLMSDKNGAATAQEMLVLNPDLFILM